MTRPSDGGREGRVRERGKRQGKGGEGYYLLSSLITRCILPSPVVTHCHPLPLVETRYYPLSPGVTRCDPSSPVIIRRQTCHPAPMARLACCLGASCFPGFLPPLLGGADGTSCVLSWSFLLSGLFASLAWRSRNRTDEQTYI